MAAEAVAVNSLVFDPKIDPKNKDVVYVANTCAYRSTDGGTVWDLPQRAGGHERCAKPAIRL